MAFQLHALGFECNCHNYIYNILVDRGLLLTDDSTIASSTGAITPVDFGEPEDDYTL